MKTTSPTRATTATAHAARHATARSCWPQYPAAEEAPGSLAVSASTESRRLAGFANRGSWVEVAAPLAAGSAALLMATQPPGGDATLPMPCQWLATDAAKRLSDRTAKLCDTGLRQIDAYAAVSDTSAIDPDC